MEEGRKTSLNARLEQGFTLSPLLISEEAAAGDALALELVLDSARYLAVGVVSMMHTIDPDAVLLGGGINFGGPDSPLGRKFLEIVREEVRRRAFPIPAQRATIDYATLGSDAGYLGAAGLARLKHLPSR
jgi:glucokinase